MISEDISINSINTLQLQTILSDTINVNVLTAIDEVEEKLRITFDQIECLNASLRTQLDIEHLTLYGLINSFMRELVNKANIELELAISQTYDQNCNNISDQNIVMQVDIIKGINVIIKELMINLAYKLEEFLKKNLIDKTNKNQINQLVIELQNIILDDARILLTKLNKKMFDTTLSGQL